jgi:hypothetical protein
LAFIVYHVLCDDFMSYVMLEWFPQYV